MGEAPTFVTSLLPSSVRILSRALLSWGERANAQLLVFPPPKYALTIALVMHELATNSAKYGALSVPETVGTPA
jgi:two-component sensor histidine kinase